MSVVSNTSPLRYLIEIGRAELVRQIFGQVLISRGVKEELTHRSCPEMVRQWMAHTPGWLEIRDLAQASEPDFARLLDQGEAQGIRSRKPVRRRIPISAPAQTSYLPASSLWSEPPLPDSDMEQ